MARPIIRTAPTTVTAPFEPVQPVPSQLPLPPGQLPIPAASGITQQLTGAPLRQLPVPPAFQAPQYQTGLSPAEEQQFQSWVKAKNVPWQDEPTADYDMRGFWKGLQTGDPRARQAESQFDGRMHFSDTWKTPYHKTLSNESIYAPPDAPHWEGNRLVDKAGRVIADETPQPPKK